MCTMLFRDVFGSKVTYRTAAGRNVASFIAEKLPQGRKDMLMAKQKKGLGPHIGFDESQTVEFKEQWVEDAMSDICAFANTDGGVLYLGVNRRGHIVPGTDVSDGHQQQVAGKIRNHLGIHADIRVEEKDDFTCLAVSVQNVAGRVALLRGKAYRRSGTSTFEVLPEEWGAFALERTNQTWDGLPSDASIDADIDAEEVRAFIRSAQAHSRPRLSADLRADSAIEVTLDTLGLLCDDQPTNACLLLFGKNPQRLCRHARVRAFYFRSINDFDEFPEITGTLEEQIAEAMRVVAVATPVRLTFSDDDAEAVDAAERTKRHESTAYPDLAVREAITNAILHRDYSTPGSEVEIKMYPDRMVITNPGSLMPGLTIEDLKRDPHPSRRRNPLLAQIAVLDHWIERAGTGTTRMIESCKDAGLPEPEFENRRSGFSVIFRKGRWNREMLESIGLNERQVPAVLHVKEHGRISLKQYRKLVDTSERSAARDLADLTGRGILRKVGAGAAAHYVLGDLPRLP